MSQPLRDSNKSRRFPNAEKKQETGGKFRPPALGGEGQTVATVLEPAMLIFLLRSMQELVRVRLEFLPHIGMGVQVIVKARMAVHELLIVDQRRIFRERTPDVRM